MANQKKPKLNLPSSLLKGMDSEEKESFIQGYLSCGIIRETLADFLHSKISSSHKESESKSTYDSPSWSELQADGNGYRRALREVINLLDQGVNDE